MFFRQLQYASHVAGIACGNGALSGGFYHGIAPKAHIISLKILDHQGQGSSLHALSAFDWILANKETHQIRVANLSIGANDRKINRPLQEGVERLWRNGIVVVAAAGNPDKKRNESLMPPLSPSIITVGSAEDMAYFQAQKPFSKFTKSPHFLPDIWRKGEDVISVLSPQYDFSLPNRSRKNIRRTHYISMSGASMATPFVSGYVALLLEQYPKATPRQVKEMLLEICKGNDGILL